MAQISLKELYTKDKVALDLEIRIFYLVDLRVANQESCGQGLRYITESVWDELLCAAITDIARNVIVVAHSFEELFPEEGRNYLRRGLSAALVQRVQGVGILLNPKIGVNIVNLQPNDAFKQAIKEETVAKTIGLAAAERLQSLGS
jgi:regulator of protease activity HflC (stomatin/prohibitin superfamily)